MAVVQISRIQVRRGQTGQTGFPQLASGEIGWSVDQQEVYIGNGAVSEGAPAIGNTRILTEHDANFFLFSIPNYTYSNTIDGPTVQTGPNDNPFISRLMQERLDDRINLKTFAAVGNGVADDTDAIRRAIAHSSLSKKPLEMNEGVFLVSEEIEVPPHVTLRGAGIGKTIIINNSTSSIFKTVGTDENNEVVPISSAAFTPRNITISGITFESTLTGAQSILKLDCVEDGYIDQCEFKADPSIVTTSTQASGIELMGQVTLSCNNVQIKNCVFRNLGTSIESDYDITNIGIHYNKFMNVDAGIAFSKNLVPGNYYGIDHADVSRNYFEKVNNEALYVGPNINGVSFVQSSHNEYIDVGIGYNNPLGDLNQATEVITFRTVGCQSESDFFSRMATINLEPLSSFEGVIKPIVLGHSIYQISNPSGKALAANSGETQVLVVPRKSYTSGFQQSVYQSITLHYTLTKNSPYVTRDGTLEITVNNNTNESTVKDTFTVTNPSDGDLIFYVDLTRSDVTVLKCNNEGAPGIISFSFDVRQ